MTVTVRSWQLLFAAHSLAAGYGWSPSCRGTVLPQLCRTSAAVSAPHAPHGVSHTPKCRHMCSMTEQCHRRRIALRADGVIMRELVTERMVEAAVKEAEDMWDAALRARQKADRLSEEAESTAEASAAESVDASAKLDESTKFSMSMLGSARTAMGSSLKATNLVADAVEAAAKADKLEEAAEEALLKSEQLLEQHLTDFPDQ